MGALNQSPLHLTYLHMASSLAHVCVTQSEIEETPSRCDGVSADTETLLRRYGCEMIDDLGTLLELYAKCLIVFS